MGELRRWVVRLFNGSAGVASGDLAPGVAAGAARLREVPAIGAVLRSARIQAGLELRDVATMLKIRFVFMEAIEAGHYQDLPGTAYAVGFIRAYADYLGLDPEAVVRQFKEEVAGNVSRQNFYFPTPVPEGTIPGGAVLLLALLLAGMVYGGWYALSASDRSLVDVVPALPHRLVTLLDAFTGHGSKSAVAPAAAPAAGSAAAGNSVSGNGVGAGMAEGPTAAASVSASGPTTAAAPAVPATQSAPAVPSSHSAPPVVAVVAPAPPTPPTASATSPEVDNPDEIPLVSGPADEAEGGPGPLVPMAPRPKPPAPPELAAVAAPAALPAALPAAAAPATPVVSPGSPAAAPPLPVASPAPPAAAAEPVLPTGRVYGSQNRESRVQIKATQDSWVQIRDGNGNPVFTKVLHPGDVFRVPDRPGMQLGAGNAGGLVAIVDGGEPRTLGQVGQVVRELPVDATALRRAGGAAN